MTLNTQEILDMASQLPLGLWEGKAGVCLYLAEVNKDAAQQLWQDIMQSLPQLCGNIDFSHGLTGIVFTAYQLEKKGMEVVDLDSLTHLCSGKWATAIVREPLRCSHWHISRILRHG